MATLNLLERKMSIPLPVLRRQFLKVATQEVPCNGCTECCRGEAVFLHPECGDNPDDYRVGVYGGRLILAHSADGNCTYLGPTGCTIQNRKPVACYELDCRDFLPGGAMDRGCRRRGVRLEDILPRSHIQRLRAAAIQLPAKTNTPAPPPAEEGNDADTRS